MKIPKKNPKKQKWTRTRHRVTTAVLRYTLGIYSRLAYHIKSERFKEQERRPYLILFNHQTAFDQFFVGLSFKGPVYYLASEDLFSNGWVSSLIRYLVAPIPIKKQTTDIHAMIHCIRVANEGGTIAIAPEGNRTFSGRTEYMKSSVVALVRRLKAPLVLYRIEGGYGVQPRWANTVRSGKMRAYVAEVVQPETVAALSDDELMEHIRRTLDVNEACVDGLYRHSKRAEYLERLLYTCPVCGLAKQESHGNELTCTVCGRRVQYLETKELEGIGCEQPYRFVADWYDAQNRLVADLDLTPYYDTPIFRDTAQLSRVHLYKKKELLRDLSAIALYADRIVLDEGSARELCFPYDQTAAVTVLSRNKVNIYFGDLVYQLKGDRRFNGIKYVNLFHHYKNVKEGNPNEQFLGL